MEDETLQETEWDDLYERLLTLLSKYGEDNYLAEKDFWIVDDNWGNLQQKVYLNNPSIFCDNIFNEIRAVMQDFKLDWEVICVWYVKGQEKEGDDVALVRKNGIRYTKSTPE